MMHGSMNIKSRPSLVATDRRKLLHNTSSPVEWQKYPGFQKHSFGQYDEQ